MNLQKPQPKLKDNILNKTTEINLPIPIGDPQTPWPCYNGVFKGTYVIVEDVRDAQLLISQGSFGESLRSKIDPIFGNELNNIPTITQKRQWKRRKDWQSKRLKLENYGELYKNKNSLTDFMDIDDSRNDEIIQINKYGNKLLDNDIDIDKTDDIPTKISTSDENIQPNNIAESIIELKTNVTDEIELNESDSSTTISFIKQINDDKLQNQTGIQKDENTENFIEIKTNLIDEHNKKMTKHDQNNTLLKENEKLYISTTSAIKKQPNDDKLQNNSETQQKGIPESINELKTSNNNEHNKNNMSFNKMHDNLNTRTSIETNHDEPQDNIGDQQKEIRETINELENNEKNKTGIKDLFSNENIPNSSLLTSDLNLGDTDSDDISSNNFETNNSSMKSNQTLKFKTSNIGQEKCILFLEESLFLSYALNCLKIKDEITNRFLNNNELWKLFIETDDEFVEKYIVYHYFRSKGWIIKSGINFGCEFALYKRGPSFYHSSCLVKIRNINHPDKLSKTTWGQIMGYCRVSETARKDFVICEVSWPDQSLATVKQCISIISKFSISHKVLHRWEASEHRET